MRQSLNAGLAPAPAAVTPGWVSVLRQRARALVGAALWLMVTLALISRHAEDPGFSTTGSGAPVHNWLGLPGAWVADVLLVIWGFSAWWWVVVGARAGLGAALRRWRAESASDQPRWTAPARWAGFALLLLCSCALEWTRLYGWEARLPGHAGGAVGVLLGPWSMRHLGFTGSGVLWIAGMVVALPLALRFSWLRMADGLGAWVDRLREQRSLERERAEDQRIGAQALREREIEKVLAGRQRHRLVQAGADRGLRCRAWRSEAVARPCGRRAL